MDRDIERRESFGDDPLEIQFGEPRERREVAVQEREAIVVVFQVERSPHALRQLMDEAELTVVVAGLDLVEDRCVYFGPHRFAELLLHDHVEALLVANHDQRHLCVIGEDLPTDHVTRHLAVDCEDLITGLEAGPSCG